MSDDEEEEEIEVIEVEETESENEEEAEAETKVRGPIDVKISIRTIILKAQSNKSTNRTSSIIKSVFDTVTQELKLPLITIILQEKTQLTV